MNTALETPQSVRDALESLQVLVDQLSDTFVGGINSKADYERASVLLDELTDGHPLNKYEERVLIELEDAILAYERDSEQFAAMNADLKAASTPVQLLKDFMATMSLTGSDLPEIGDKTAVSKVLSGSRAISHKMAYALARRFGTNPEAFIEESKLPLVASIDALFPVIPVQPVFPVLRVCDARVGMPDVIASVYRYSYVQFEQVSAFVLRPYGAPVSIKADEKVVIKS